MLMKTTQVQYFCKTLYILYRFLNKNFRKKCLDCYVFLSRYSSSLMKRCIIVNIQHISKEPDVPYRRFTQ